MTVRERTIETYLQQEGLELASVHRGECDRFGLELPTLPDWEVVPEHLFPHATAVLHSPVNAVEGFVPNAVVLVGKLSRSVHPESLLDCGFGDSRALPGWVEIGHDRDSFRGLPAVSIAGRYDCDGRLLFARTRYVVVHHIVDHYLVQVTVTVPDSLRQKLSCSANEFIDDVRIGQG
ncbi:LpqN/LpqT family lipoprotein [Rhodococcus sp. IEGM 1330]|uniref:LpqN/LpqT family lipoprotein n=1 Tax=Rhodococcus sp. IEGM 1330 TaxID=3082225 RepID=UPI0029533473|nr:LpqN/LpqT family lipoprotein [Rhodococcus sp. IEGM 1330]MDV8023919.1 LpqN/LpqT family lipoprotein [Rhodococcus sp. IEGM 1330]